MTLALLSALATRACSVAGYDGQWATQELCPGIPQRIRRLDSTNNDALADRLKNEAVAGSDTEQAADFDGNRDPASTRDLGFVSRTIHPSLRYPTATIKKRGLAAPLKRLRFAPGRIEPLPRLAPDCHIGVTRPKR